MWNFLEFAWLICGGFSAYYMIKQALKRDGQITAKSAATALGFFMGGIVSAVYVISNDGDSIVLFKDKPNANQTQSQAQAQPAQVTPQPQPAYQSVSKPPKGGSVLDG
jgi:hypothetical protein